MAWVKRPLVLGLVLACLAGPAGAETIRVAVGQRGNWDTSVSELGQQAGFFKKRGLELDLLYTQGGGETQQAVLARSATIGVAAGTLGVLGAAARGAPVRIIGGQTTGAGDLYWYVPAASAVRTPADMKGRTVGFSTVGSSTHSTLLQEQAQDKIDLKPVATGAQPATYTQVMSGQIDVGWAAAPFGLDKLGRDTRLVFRGSDVAAARNQTIRVLVAHAADLASQPDVIARYLGAYRETLDWMYAGDEALVMYAKFSGVSEAVARRTRDEFFPKANLDPASLSGLDSIMADGVTFKFLAAPLSAAQLDGIIATKRTTP